MDNQPKCFVPDCNNKVGVLFPKNPIVKKKWLKSLGLEHLNFKIDSKSFVCLDHFEENGQPGTVPKSTTSEVPSAQNVSNNSRPVETNQQITRHSSYKADIQHKIDSAVVIQAIKKDMTANSRIRSKKISDSVADFQTKTEDVKQREERFKDNEVLTSHDNTCRLCMSRSSELMENVYNKIDEKYTIAHMITVCLNPLQILPTDKLSKNICTKCLQSLKEYFKFHQLCLGMDAKQRELLSVEQDYTSDGHYAESENSEEYLHVERLSDYEENKENKDESKNEKTSGHVNKRLWTEQEHRVKGNHTRDKSEIDIKFDRVEEELAKVLEGEKNTEFADSKITSQSEKSNLYQPKVAERSAVINNYNQDKTTSISNASVRISSTTNSNHIKGKDDEIYTENIIIEMINDEEHQPTPAVKLPITIKRISPDAHKRKPLKRKRNNSNDFNTSNQNMTMIKSGNNEEVVVLPSGIKVEIKEKYYSPLGSFPCQTIKYVFDTEFLLAGGYLYEYWLAKNDVRHLHCIVPRCSSVATQSRLDRNTFSNDIEVVKAHDHEAPDELERKRQMFYNIMYEKMRRDRNFNFKLLYEQFCRLDQDLKEILPLRKVISEICKQGPIVQPPIMNSFEQFYNSIESDVFHKVHFTDNHVQFYQDRFETDNGGKAVVFSNTQVVELYSYSKLMYVDASFHIESNDFPYKLVTVLVWVYESYYPILYAFVNQKSQDIYKQIFNFLYNSLAPNLRPEEIITDYEANLYYALGETYVESSIGGSVFYFTQNLYKKICALNLSRELDLNSNFRSIYNMLLMLPLLPVNTILDGLNNIEVQARELGLEDLTNELFIHVHNEWICNVTPEFFCVHRLENRINENIVAPFKKLRDLIMFSRNKSAKNLSVASVVHVIEKILELEKFLRNTYSGPGKKTFAKDLSSSQKKIVLKAWNFIENHPKININHFFLKVLGYIKCLENQLWIWGFYRYKGDVNDELINANNFQIVNELNRDLEYEEHQEDTPMYEKTESENQEEEDDVIEEFYIEDTGTIRRIGGEENNDTLEEFSDEPHNSQAEERKQHLEKEQPAVLMEAVIDENGGFVLQNTTNTTSASSTDSNFFVYK